jgi:hypothetical protein
MVRSPLSTSEHPALVVTRLISLEAVSLGAKGLDLVEHPLKQGLGSGGRSASPLELEDFPALAAYLRVHGRIGKESHRWWRTMIRYDQRLCISAKTCRLLIVSQRKLTRLISSCIVSPRKLSTRKSSLS